MKTKSYAILFMVFLALTVCCASYNTELSFLFAILCMIYLALMGLHDALISIQKCFCFLILSTVYSLII